MNYYIYKVYFILLIFGIGVFEKNVFSEELDNSPNSDPFGRGLKLMKSFDGFHRSFEDSNFSKIKLYNTEKNIFGDGIYVSNSSFDDSLYRLEGVLVSHAPQLPVIHIDTSDLNANDDILFFNPDAKRWTFRPGTDVSKKNILSKFRLQWRDLTRMNGDNDLKNTLEKNDIFVSPVNNASLFYTVNYGDTLYNLSRVYGISLSELAKKNQISSKDVLYVGQKLLIRKSTITDDMKIDEVSFDVANQLKIKSENKISKSYLRILHKNKLKDIKRISNEFYGNFQHYIDSDIILRKEKNNIGVQAYYLDIGPMKSQRHAEAFCKLFESEGIICAVVNRFPTQERQNTFSSTAVLKTSQPLTSLSKKNDIVKSDNVEYVSYNLFEGQEIEELNALIIKITNHEIIAIDENNNLISLFSNFFSR
tara:strand:+ start:464 stop:1723 length:1260 start_codon:yes stop_codon:yes gene_type:complete